MERSGVVLVCLSSLPDHQEVMYSLYSELRRAGECVWTVGRLSPKTRYASFDGFNYYIRAPERPGITRSSFDIPGILKLCRTVLGLHPRYVYIETIHFWNVFLLAVLRVFGIVSLQAIHDVDPHDHRGVLRILYRILSSLSCFVVLRNRRDIRPFAKAFHLNPTRVLFIYPWRVFSRYAAPTDSGKFLFCGRLKRYKGLDLLASIAEGVPEAQFVVAGPADAEVDTDIVALRSLPNVSVQEGYIDDSDMEGLFFGCDWVVLPYRSATQSGVVLDAYRYSRPVIAFDVGALSEQVLQDRTGMLIPAKDTEMFVAAIRQAIQMSDCDLRRYCHNAFEFGEVMFSARTACQSFIAILRLIDKTMGA